MKQFKMSVLLLILASLFLSACSAPVGSSKQPTLAAENNVASSSEFIGYITKIENQRALVVSPKSRQINQSTKEFYDAIWFSNMPKDIEVGQYVRVLFEGALAASYPGGGKASNVTISKIQKPEKAVLSQDEVIREAILNKDVSSINLLVIKDVIFDQKLAIWTIHYKEAMITDSTLEEHTIEVPDK